MYKHTIQKTISACRYLSEEYPTPVAPVCSDSSKFPPAPMHIVKGN